MLPLFRTEGLTLTWFLSIFDVEVCDSVRLVMGLGILTLSMSFLTVDWRRHGNEDWILDILSFMPHTFKNVLKYEKLWKKLYCFRVCNFHVYLYIFHFQVKEAKIRAVHLTTKRIIHLQKAAFLEEKKILQICLNVLKLW